MNKTDQPETNKEKLGAVHHYVPQGYLKRFGTEKNLEQIVAYEVGRNPYVTNIHNIAGQRDFYTFTNENGAKDSAMEDALAEVDAAGVNVLRVLDDMPDGYIELPEEQKGNLLAYIAFQHTRNLQERKMWAVSYAQSSRMIMQVAASHKESYHRNAQEALGDKYDEVQVERTRATFLKGDADITFDPMDQYFMGVALDMSKTLYKILFTQKQLVLVRRATDAGVFITSDNPVTHYLIEEQRARRSAFYQGVGYLDAVFQMPISPDRCLLLINKDMSTDVFVYEQNDVDYINHYTYHFADRWVFSNLKDETIKERLAQFKRTTPLTSISSPFDRAKEK